MSGHSKWAGIKHQKGITDKKRGVLFSKLSRAITAAAAAEPNPDFNPRLRDCIKKAREALMSQDTIDNAIQKAADSKEASEEILCEAYGAGGVAILIECLTDNKNRTIPEIKKILSDHGGKWAESGSVLWAFEKTGHEFTAKFPQEVPLSDRESVENLVAALEEHEDAQKVLTSMKTDAE